MKVMYHNIEPKPGCPWDFDLTQQQMIVARAKEDDESSVSQVNTAGKLDVCMMRELNLVHICWSCKWSANGLMPVRPLLVFKDAMTLPAESSLKL